MMISSYQSDLESIFESIEQKIDHVNKVGDATETQAVIAKCQQDLKHADNIVRQVRCAAVFCSLIGSKSL